MVLDCRCQDTCILGATSVLQLVRFFASRSLQELPVTMSARTLGGDAGRDFLAPSLPSLFRLGVMWGRWGLGVASGVELRAGGCCLLSCPTLPA